MTSPKRHAGSGIANTAAPVRAKSVSMTDLARQPEARLALDNDALFQVAENLIYLRRHRKLTQANLAKKMGTSQAKVARIEGGRENVTLRTLQKAVVALEGRLSLSVSPAELEWPKAPSWWSEGDRRRGARTRR